MTDARKGEDGVKVADFNTKNWNMVLILDSNSKVRTAFVWEYDGTTPGVGDGFDFEVADRMLYQVDKASGRKLS